MSGWDFIVAIVSAPREPKNALANTSLSHRILDRRIHEGDLTPARR